MWSSDDCATNCKENVEKREKVICKHHIQWPAWKLTRLYFLLLDSTFTKSKQEVDFPRRRVTDIACYIRHVTQNGR
jgi:hypothetical protein